MNATELFAHLWEKNATWCSYLDKRKRKVFCLKTSPKEKQKKVGFFFFMIQSYCRFVLFRTADKMFCLSENEREPNKAMNGETANTKTSNEIPGNEEL